MSPSPEPDREAERSAAVDALEAALEHRFTDRRHLELALRHASFAHEAALEKRGRRGVETEGEAAEDGHDESNERLEFLGDAVLGLVVAESLYAARPEWQEGELTRALHAVVEGRSLTALARRLGVGPVLRLGRTEASSGGEDKDSILEDAMEALIGAIYLDAGLDAVRAFVRRAFAAALAADAEPVSRDPKTELQERLMRDVGEFPRYRLVADTGVEGDDLRFSVEAVSQGRVLADGTARTKRAAEKIAARAALVALDAATGTAGGHHDG